MLYLIFKNNIVISASSVRIIEVLHYIFEVIKICSKYISLISMTPMWISEQNFTYNEATQSIKENHPLLYAKWEAEKAEELKENEARYGSKVEIVGDKFQQSHNVCIR